ncbi:UNVERIFIED_ORG: NTE family protein [Xanthobacter viscosus]|jgi:NTE family protein|uniref:Patatin-like phospholipase family protein n=1 Tax=Xanthobacter autotrophicus TaxID=280 RepID=A0A6C1KBW5_XANAU|nr:patatin-like phospholipase family protein [Xanthobacter autotrophicus]TLX40734.1 patatin-like phospholipase family protein [Xanthobacter autotrophicus]
MEREPVLVDFALQGGGSHGAFTWGVLDRLLEETWLDIEGVSGTSAGAMNAAVLADGYAAGGRQGAQQALESYWRHVSEAARFSPFKRSPIDKMFGRWSLDSAPGFLFMDIMTRMFSPYQYNPMGGNALAPILAKEINFERLRSSPIKVFITATNVRTGRPRVFRNADITPEVLMASACLPTLFQAVEIDGEAYWDGGYSGNPTLAPLVSELTSDDTILVPINPLERPGTPKTPSEILNRLNEVSFNSVAVKELYMMAMLQRHVSELSGDTEACNWARMRVHIVRNPIMAELGFSSKLNAEWDFLTMLKEEGRKAAQVFLDDHGHDIGKASTVRFEELLQEL